MFTTIPLKKLSQVIAGAALITVGITGITQQAEAASIVQDSADAAYQINFHSPLGQTFTAEDSWIDSIGFYIQDFNPHIAPDDFDIGVSLYEGVGSSGNLLGSGIYNTLTNGYVGWADIDFSSVVLNVGSTYTAIVTDNTVRWGLSLSANSDVYSGGSAIIFNELRPNSDLRFRVLASSKPVPEPASVLGLLSFAAIGTTSLVTRKRQQKVAIKA
jgi:hypothetical protein